VAIMIFFIPVLLLMLFLTAKGTTPTCEDKGGVLVGKQCIKKTCLIEMEKSNEESN
jgi:hypothetical protein